MKWSRTETLYIEETPLIADTMAQRVARRCGELGHHLRQRVELAFTCDQGVERRVAEQREREPHPSGRVPARPLRGCHPPDLRRLQCQPPRVKRSAERERNGLASVPAHLDDRCLEPGDPQCELE